MSIIESTYKAFSFLSGRRAAYRNIFLSPESKRNVLPDLARFCRANESCFHPDARMHAVLEGRREVWNRIQSHINLPPEELWALYNPGTPLTLGE